MTCAETLNDMKVQISKDYSMWESIRKNDLCMLRRNESITVPGEYHTWETIEVTEEELLELIRQGNAIMINC